MEIEDALILVKENGSKNGANPDDIIMELSSIELWMVL